MWLIDNDTDYLVDKTIVVDKHGARHWVVVVKATFDIYPDGTLELSKKPLAPFLVGEYRAKPGESSLLYEADLVSDKPATDILLNATAYAPDGKPVRALSVAFGVGSLSKTLKVRGDRVYERSVVGAIAASDAQPFVEMPIVYERAYGGHDRSAKDPAQQKMFAPNPVGTGIAIADKNLLGKPVANIEFEGQAKRRDEAAGFGPLCSYWQPRIKYAGTYDAAWVKSQKPLLPLDYDERWNMCAPADQQAPSHELPGAKVVLSNLTPQGYLSFLLPKIYLTFTTRFAGYAKREPMEHRAKLHSVIVEPSAPRVIMVWHTRLSCGNAVDDIDATLVAEKPYV